MWYCRQRLDEFAVEEIADIVPVEVEDVVVVAAHAVVVDHEIDERARRRYGIRAFPA